MAPIRTVDSPINRLKPSKPGIAPRPLASNRVAHAAIYGNRSDAQRMRERSAPGQMVDGTLTIKHGDRR